MCLPRVVEVYRAQPWYAARPETEVEFVGALEAAHPVIGPGNRPASFVLRTADETLAIYASGVEDKLGPLAGPRLRIRGKLVDLTGEGGTRELWISTIDRAGRA
jgi:hypothetical protein